MLLYNEMINERDICDVQATQIAGLRCFYTEVPELVVVHEDDMILDDKTSVVVDETNSDVVAAWLAENVDALRRDPMFHLGVMALDNHDLVLTF